MTARLYIVCSCRGGRLYKRAARAVCTMLRNQYARVMPLGFNIEGGDKLQKIFRNNNHTNEEKMENAKKFLNKEKKNKRKNNNGGGGGKKNGKGGGEKNNGGQKKQNNKKNKKGKKGKNKFTDEHVKKLQSAMQSHFKSQHKPWLPKCTHKSALNMLAHHMSGAFENQTVPKKMRFRIQDVRNDFDKTLIEWGGKSHDGYVHMFTHNIAVATATQLMAALEKMDLPGKRQAVAGVINDKFGPELKKEMEGDLKKAFTSRYSQWSKETIPDLKYCENGATLHYNTLIEELLREMNYFSTWFVELHKYRYDDEIDFETNFVSAFMKHKFRHIKGNGEMEEEKTTVSYDDQFSNNHKDDAFVYLTEKPLFENRHFRELYRDTHKNMDFDMIQLQETTIHNDKEMEWGQALCISAWEIEYVRAWTRVQNCVLQLMHYIHQWVYLKKDIGYRAMKLYKNTLLEAMNWRLFAPLTEMNDMLTKFYMDQLAAGIESENMSVSEHVKMLFEKKATQTESFVDRVKKHQDDPKERDKMIESAMQIALGYALVPPCVSTMNEDQVHLEIGNHSYTAWPPFKYFQLQFYESLNRRMLLYTFFCKECPTLNNFKYFRTQAQYCARQGNTVGIDDVWSEANVMSIMQSFLKRQMTKRSVYLQGTIGSDTYYFGGKMTSVKKISFPGTISLGTVNGSDTLNDTGLGGFKFEYTDWKYIENMAAAQEFESHENNRKALQQKRIRMRDMWVTFFTSLGNGSESRHAMYNTRYDAGKGKRQDELEIVWRYIVENNSAAIFKTMNDFGLQIQITQTNEELQEAIRSLRFSNKEDFDGILDNVKSSTWFKLKYDNSGTRLKA